MLCIRYATADVAHSPLTLQGVRLANGRCAGKRRKGVINVDKRKLASEEKLDRLLEQMATFRRGQAILERFERVARKWLQRAQAAKREGDNHELPDNHPGRQRDP